MIPPTVDTFEQDIVKEIQQKEASIMDIASSIGDISNKEEDVPKDKTVMMSIALILVASGIIGVGYLVYLSYQGTFSSTINPINSGIVEKQPITSSIPIMSLSPSLDKAVGQSLTNAQKTNEGYTIGIVSYSPVFAYMLRNEKEFAEDLAVAIGNNHTTKNAESVSPQIPTTTASSTGTSTPITATSTVATTSVKMATEQNNLPKEYIFSDITINNQNMRVATSLYGTVAYAFVGTNTLIVSSSTEGIIALRSSILNK